MTYDNILKTEFDTDTLAEEFLRRERGIQSDDELIDIQLSVFRSFLQGIADWCGDRARALLNEGLGEAGVRQQQVAYFLDVTQPQVSKILSGKVELSYATLVKILWVFAPDYQGDVFFAYPQQMKTASAQPINATPVHNENELPSSEERILAGLVRAMEYVRRDVLRETTGAVSMSPGQLARLLKGMKVGGLPQDASLRYVLRDWHHSLSLSLWGLGAAHRMPGVQILGSSPDEFGNQLAAARR